MIRIINETSPILRGIAAVIFFVIACVIVSQTYVYERWFILPNKTRNYAPGLVSGFIAIALTTPVFRADLFVTHGKGFLPKLVGLSIAVLLFYLTASLANIGLGGDGWLSKPISYIILLIIIVANINPHRYGEIALFSVAVLAAWNIVEADKMMGFYGFLLAAFFYAGLLCATDLEKISSLVRGPQV